MLNKTCPTPPPVLPDDLSLATHNIGGRLEPRTIQAEYEIRLLGAQRSGNNAIIAWLTEALHGAVLKATNCSFSTGNRLFLPYDKGSAPLIDLPENAEKLFAANSWHLYAEDASTVFRGSAKRDVIQGEPDDNEWIRNNEAPEWDARLRKLLDRGPAAALGHIRRLFHNCLSIVNRPEIQSRQNAVIYHLEDFRADHLSIVPWQNSALSVQGKQCIYMLVLREFSNWIASRIKSGRSVDQQIVDQWISAAQMAERSDFEGCRFVFIKYDSWLKSREYRKQIAGQIGIDDVEPSQKVLVAGGGSSFDGISRSGKLDREALSRRSEGLDSAQLSLHHSILQSNQAAIELSRRLFQESCAR